MEVCRLCLDLNSDNNWSPLDGTYKKMVQVVVPELNLELTNAPKVCHECTGSLDQLFIFKTKCFENQEQLRSKRESNGMEKCKKTICRTCVHPIESESFIILKPSKVDVYLQSMLSSCLPEIDLEITTDPVMCKTCLEDLQKLYQFRRSCLLKETKIAYYVHMHGPISSNKINLQKVLEYVSSRMETNSDVNVKSEPFDRNYMETENNAKMKENLKHEAEDNFGENGSDKAGPFSSANQPPKPKLFKKNPEPQKINVNSLREVWEKLQTRNVLSSDAIEHLEKSFEYASDTEMTEMLHSVLSCIPPEAEYPLDLKNFAIILNFYSSQEYDYIQKTYNIGLPDRDTIRKWSTSKGFNPGFSAQAFAVLENKVKQAKELGKHIICSLLLNGVQINKKMAGYDDGREWGRLDVGTEMDNEDIMEASEALVPMVVAHNSAWKLPIAYFTLNGLTSSEMANLVNEALIRLENINVTITSVTCTLEGPCINMFKQLGCDFTNIKKIRSYFPHPSNKEKRVYAFFDVFMTLRLLRFYFMQAKVSFDRDGNQINWDFVYKLERLKDHDVLMAARKVGKVDVWKKLKMEVKLTEEFSNTIADALSFLCNDLKLPQFRGCQATIKFMRTMANLFDLLTSRLLWEKDFKAPLTRKNELWRTFLMDAISYGLDIKDRNGKYLWKTKETTFMGLAVSIYSLVGIYDDYVETNMLPYIFTYNCSLGHLDHLAVAVSARHKWDFPSAYTFMLTYKNLVTQPELSKQQPESTVLHATTLLTVRTGPKKDRRLVNIIDVATIKRNGIGHEKYERRFPPNFYEVLPIPISTTLACEDVSEFIARYVIKVVHKLVFCQGCLELLIQFNAKRIIGGYLSPTKGVKRICYETEMFIRKPTFKSQLPESMILQRLSGKLAWEMKSIFSCHEEHNFSLLKVIINCYYQIRIKNLARRYPKQYVINVLRRLSS